MPTAAGLRVPRSEAEATRRRLLDLGVLRLDLQVAQDGDHVVLPVADSCGPRLPVVAWDFEGRAVRPASYMELLRLPAALRELAPRAFDQVGDVILVKVPPELAQEREELGRALLAFHKHARVAFQDHGVVGPYRTRKLDRIAGLGGSLTRVAENGVRLWVDPAAAYFSPRLAHERERVARLVEPGERVTDLFAGVAPFAVQCALRGAQVEAVDLNPAAIELARRNVDANSVADRVRLHCGDAREVAPRLPPADRVLMNLPHAAASFLDVAAQCAAPDATLHHHEILATDRIEARAKELERVMAGLGRKAGRVSARIVRHYSSQDEHVAFDIPLIG